MVFDGIEKQTLRGIKQLAWAALMLMYSGNLVGQEVQVPSDLPQQTLKTSAFQVLRQQCNACHASKRSTTPFTFTWENMDSLSNQIQVQVFLKRRMPKGRKNRLTPVQEAQLKRWLATIETP